MASYMLCRPVAFSRVHVTGIIKKAPGFPGAFYFIVI